MDYNTKDATVMLGLGYVAHLIRESAADLHELRAKLLEDPTADGMLIGVIDSALDLTRFQDQARSFLKREAQ